MGLILCLAGIPNLQDNEIFAHKQGNCNVLGGNRNTDNQSGEKAQNNKIILIRPLEKRTKHLG